MTRSRAMGNHLVMNVERQTWYGFWNVRYCLWYVNARVMHASESVGSCVAALSLHFLRVANLRSTRYKKDEVDQNWTFAYIHNWAIYLISEFVSKCVTQENSHFNENSAYDQWKYTYITNDLSGFLDVILLYHFDWKPTFIVIVIMMMIWCVHKVGCFLFFLSIRQKKRIR